MPTFRTTPSQNLGLAIRRAVDSSRLNGGALDMQADLSAAKTAREMGLAEKARAEVEAMRQAQADRTDPSLATDYAGNAAGLNRDDSHRLADSLSGKLEQPSAADYDDNSNVQPFLTQPPPAASDGQKRVFQSALASTIANRLATGKTNAAQLAQAGDRINETALTQRAADTEDVPEANRIVAAVAGKIRNPYATGPAGSVLNRETGDVDEDTQAATDASSLSGARTKTEGTKQTANAARADLATARKDAVIKAADRGGKTITPQQVERWVSEVARREWDAIPGRERKGMTYAQHLDKVRERFTPKADSPGAADEVAEAHAAIANGADAAKVAKRFKERMKFDLPAAPQKVAAPAAIEDDDEEED